jgi:hypothetical protein
VSLALICTWYEPGGAAEGSNKLIPGAMLLPAATGHLSPTSVAEPNPRGKVMGVSPQVVPLFAKMGTCEPHAQRLRTGMQALWNTHAFKRHGELRLAPAHCL